jgi:hypothetical protein
MSGHEFARRLASRDHARGGRSVAILAASPVRLPEPRRCGERRRGRAEEVRRVKLDLVRDQIQDGTLVICRMIKEERRRSPARTTPPKRPRRR